MESRALAGPSEPSALVVQGRVWHARSGDTQHAFAYPAPFLLLPMRRLRAEPAAAGALSRAGFAPLSFYDPDHGDGRPLARGGALAWLDELLERSGVQGADGEVWWMGFARMWGHAFKPVSFWMCEDREGRLRAVVAEVNNTFGERHCYVLDDVDWGRRVSATKVFHVSPFLDRGGRYEFCFRRRQRAGRTTHILAQVDYHQPDGVCVRTAVGGSPRALDRQAHWQTVARAPLHTLAVIWRIHWQALCLWIKGIAVRPKPEAPHAQPH